MSHISLDRLLAFDNGQLSWGETLVLKGHLELCAHCRHALQDVRDIGGALLETLDDAPLAEDALDWAMARIERPLNDPSTEASVPTTPKTVQKEAQNSPLPPYLKGFDLPPSLTRAAIRPRYWAAPRVWVAPLESPHSKQPSGRKKRFEKTYLMYVPEGMKMPTHDHSGEELSLILTGGYHDGVSQYHRGDLSVCDEGFEHAPETASDEGCLLLVNQKGAIRPKTLLGKLLQPFARL